MSASIPKMDLGTTGLAVSELSLGCARLPFGGSEADVEDAQATVLRSLELGIDLIDVSPLYGARDVEPGLGLTLQGVPRETYVLSTKTGYVMNEQAIWERKHLDRSRRRPVPQDFRYDFTARSVDKSLRALRQERIEIVQFDAPSSE